MKSNEILVPYMADDFEQGDSVFRINHGHVAEFGIVGEVDDDIIDLTLDDGQRHWIPISEFQNLNSDEGMVYKLTKGVAWGKMMNVNALEVGSRVSRYDFFDKIRIYGHVSEFQLPVNKEKQGWITLVWESRDRERAHELSDMHQLKKVMMHYDLEE